MQKGNVKFLLLKIQILTWFIFQQDRDVHGVRFQGLDGNGLDREFQDEPTGQRLHRRDTPHHLKNKRIHQQVIYNIKHFCRDKNIYIFISNQMTINENDTSQDKDKEKEKVALIIAQALKNKEGGDASQVEVSPNSKAGEMNHDSFDGESNARRPSSGERIPNNGKYNI